MPGTTRGWRFCFPYDMFAPEWCTEEWRSVPIRRYAFPNMALDGSAREPQGEGKGFSWEGAPPNDEDLPDLLLVDDLCGNPAFADAESRRGFVRELYGLRSRPEHRTVIYATRDGDDALAVSDCIAVLDGGRIVQFGTSDEVQAQPANELVAQLFGRARHQ